MNTLLPLPDLAASAECLDDRRLNRQRSDIVALLKKLDAPVDEKDHPLVKMWRGNEPFLIKYGMIVCIEHQSRGNRDATLARIMEFSDTFEDSTKEPPEWWGDEKFHDSHKSYLLRSLPSHYREFWRELPDELPLMWPRSPEKGRKDKERRAYEMLVKKAHKARDKAEKAIEDARIAAEIAGLDPETLEPLPEDEIEMETIGTPADDVIDL